MLVFACAGLDAGMKALIEDAFPTFADRVPAAQSRLEDFTVRVLAGATSGSARVLSRVLAHPVSPRAGLVSEFVDELTGGSLQSVEELQRVRSALGIPDDSEVTRHINGLRPVFVARNEISHEMDLTGPTVQRRRRHRGIDATVAMADSALAVGLQVVAHVAATTTRT
jgi:hypothetical protein